ncbi:phosphatase PAP2 family protein [Amycolatopsis sp. H20-H5]|uniref:phosphatase PAP2 family protein n=1 Tax=Amycolatopsis sp. H20-H5 TaxID=3046309 RepID=UPI002DBD3D52|nr:phosphatase PAP2 family protein [Amycolatopsis sp. H20-H5]MEC3981100.1 phosphatase PAP2 family protein [Amycolatopsis sp. H20-H5]
MHRPTAVLAAGCAVATAVLGVVFAGEHSPSTLDAAVADAVHQRLGAHTGVLRALDLPTEPYVLIPVLALVALACLLTRRRADALLTVAAPSVAVAVNTWLLKPLFGRYTELGLAYPSGHTVSLVSTLAVLVVLARPGAQRVSSAVLAAVALLCATIGMVGLGYHYFTDIVGGTLFAVAVVLSFRLVLRPVAPSPAPARSAC